jgi:hypothetical protein
MKIPSGSCTTRQITLNDGSTRVVLAPKTTFLPSLPPSKKLKEKLSLTPLPPSLRERRPTPPRFDLETMLDALYHEVDTKVLIANAKKKDAGELLEEYRGSSEIIKRKLLPVLAERAKKVVRCLELNFSVGVPPGVISPAAKQQAHTVMRFLYFDALHYKDQNSAWILFRFLREYYGFEECSYAASDMRFALWSRNVELIKKLSEDYPKTYTRAKTLETTL